MQLTPILERLLAYAVRAQPAIASRLQSGYDQQTIEQIVPFYLPPEVIELYQWHNGTPDDEANHDVNLFYYHRFLPIEEAYAIYQELMQVNIDSGCEGYDPNLFPLFTFAGEYYSVWFGPPAERFGTIYFVLQGDGQVYDNLSSMLHAILECYDTGAYQIKDDVIVVDKAQVAAIKAKWNSCRRLANGATLDYHP